jgi:hypothetical protein
VVNGRRWRRKGRVVLADGVALRTQVAAHLLRADSNCFPYLRVPLRHCSPPRLVGCAAWLSGCSVCT